MQSDFVKVVAYCCCNAARIGNRRKPVKQKAKCILLRNILCKIIEAVAIMWFRPGWGYHHLPYRYRVAKPVNELKRANAGKPGYGICGKYK